MKHTKQILILMAALVLLLSACTNNNAGATGDESAGNSTTVGSGTETETVGSGTKTDKGTAEMDEVNQLIFGTLMLDGTSEEVTAEQAETFLPLWKLYETMSTEDATASEELDMIIKQIKTVFTEEQLTAMAGLDYSKMMEMMSELGLETLEESSFDRDDMPESSDGGGGGKKGGDGGGDGGGGGGDMGTGVDITGSIDPTALATAQAEGAGSSRTNRQTQMFLPALIEYLGIKADS